MRESWKLSGFTTCLVIAASFGAVALASRHHVAGSESANAATGQIPQSKLGVATFGGASVTCATGSEGRSAGFSIALALGGMQTYVLEFDTSVASGPWNLRVDSDASGSPSWYSVPNSPGPWSLRFRGVDHLAATIYSDTPNASLAVNLVSLRLATADDCEVLWGSGEHPIATDAAVAQQLRSSLLAGASETSSEALILRLRELVYEASVIGGSPPGHHLLAIDATGRATLDPPAPVVGLCGDLARQLRVLLVQCGLHARVVQLGTAEWLSPTSHAKHSGDTHVAVEAFDSAHRRWVLVDPTFNAHFEDARGSIIGIEELHRIVVEGKPWKLVTGSLTKPSRSPEDYYLPYASLLEYVYAPAIGEFPAFNPTGLTPQQVLQRASDHQRSHP